MARERTFPEAFLRRLAEIIPEERLAGVQRTLSGTQKVAFRANTLRTTGEEVAGELRAELSGLALVSLEWFRDGFVAAASERERILASRAFREGLLWVQNPSSMVPPVVLAPDPSHAVLDLAAAPGSKTLQMACAMGSGADIAAVEMVRPRFYRLKRNLMAQGAGFVKTFQRDGTTVPMHRPNHFDRVLIDAPCSTEGRMRTDDPDSWRHWSERKVKTMAGKQRRLLEAAIRCVKPGGVVVYSTCSFAPEENEAVLQHALDTFGDDIDVEPIDLELPTATNTMAEWNGQIFSPGVSRALRVLPDDTYEAFFVAKIRRID